MAMLRFVPALLVLLAFTGVLPQRVYSATPLFAENADKVVSLRNLTTNVNEVSGEIVNNSKDPVRDVNLQILYSWRWNNEMHPGTNDPGQAFYQIVEPEIAPGQSTRFSFKPPTPMTTRRDGYYDIIVKVVGYSQVYRGESRAR